MDAKKDQLHSLAASGDLEALCKLAVCYEVGAYGEVDIEKAAALLRDAAGRGSARAARRLAELMALGLVEGTDAQIAEFMRKAKAGGVKEAKDHAAMAKPGFRPVRLQQEKVAPSVIKKILVIEDEEAVRQVQVELLERAGFKVVSAPDGRVGLSTLSQNPDVSLIICDLIMPHVNGFQFVETIRNLRAAEGVPIVMCSGQIKTEYLGHGKKLGINSWVAKPFDQQKLLDLAIQLTNQVRK